MMLAMKQFDPVNRDLEIRDLYNMEDGFHLGDSYGGAYRARLNANLAFWDGIDGKTDWLPTRTVTTRLTSLVLADFLVVDLTKPYAEHGSFLEIELAALRWPGPSDLRRTGPQRRRDGHDLHPADQRRERDRSSATGSTRRPDPQHAPSPTCRRRIRTRPNPPSTTSDERQVGMTGGHDVELDLDDIQSGALHERPSPYVGTYVLLRIDDRAAGRELVRRLLAVVDHGQPSAQPKQDGWITVAFTYQGLKALGVPQESLDSFAPEFQQGMAARAAELGDVGESAPEHWEYPLGTSEVHVALAALSPDAARLQAVAERARRAHQELSGVDGDLESGLLPAPDGPHLLRVQGRHRSARGRRQRPAAVEPEGGAAQGRRDHARLPDETGELPPMPTPEVLGRNGTYIVFRKLHTKVAAYRQYLRAKAASRADEALLGAKMVGRWQSGAPLALAPDRDDPRSAPTRSRNNDFLTPTTSAASSVRPARTRDERTRGTPSTETAVSTSASTG